MVGMEARVPIPFREVGNAVAWNEEEEGGREGETTGVVLYLGSSILLLLRLMLSCGVFRRLSVPGVLASRSLGRG